MAQTPFHPADGRRRGRPRTRAWQAGTKSWLRRGKQGCDARERAGEAHGVEDVRGAKAALADELLGLKPTTLNEMIKRHNILLPRERERRTTREMEEAKTSPA